LEAQEMVIRVIDRLAEGDPVLLLPDGVLLRWLLPDLRNRGNLNSPAWSGEPG